MSVTDGDASITCSPHGDLFQLLRLKLLPEAAACLKQIVRTVTGQVKVESCLYEVFGNPSPPN